MNVLALDAHVHDTEVFAFPRRRDGTTDRVVRAPAQSPHSFHDPQRDVHGSVLRELSA